MPIDAGAADAHLRRADPVMAALIDAQGPLRVPAPRAGHYAALVRAIVGQQLSAKAAGAIHGRLVDLFGGHEPQPAELLAIEPERLRAVGLSRAKVASLRSLAERVGSGALDLDAVGGLDDEALVAE